MSRGLLDGMRVLDAGIWRPVPHATQLLADLGADVLKLEPPGGDPMRTFPDIFRDVASHKGSVVLDLRSEAGRARALDLASRSDVFCEGWRPGVADRLGVGYEHVKAVNPSIIYCSVSGYGQTGALTSVPGHDVNYQALAGAIARANAPDDVAIPRVPIADLAAATVAALAICAAWANRLRTGEGERIDVAMADVVASWIGPRSGNAIRGRDEPTRGSTGYGVFRCADGGWLALGVIAEDHFWNAVCEGLAIADLGALSYFDRLDRFDECQQAIANACATLARDDAVARLSVAGAPVTPVLTPEEMGALPHFRERGVIAVDDDHELRVGFPAVFAGRPAHGPGPSPRPDADRDAWRDPRETGPSDEYRLTATAQPARRSAMAQQRPVLDQINIVTRDIDASVAFYRRLGVDIPDRAREWDAHHRSAEVSSGADVDIDSLTFANVWDEGWRSARGGAGCVLGFKVASREEVDRIYADLTGAGCHGQQPPWDAFWGARYAVVEDPDGNAVGLMSPVDPSLRWDQPPPS